VEARSRVEQFESIRRGHRDGASIRDLADSHGVHRRTVRAALQDAVPASRAIPELAFPVSGVWEPIVSGWLVADQEVHRKQRHTAKRMWERLVEEHDAVISESTHISKLLVFEGPPIYRTPRIGGSHVKYGNCTIGEEAPLFS